MASYYEKVNEFIEETKDEIENMIQIITKTTLTFYFHLLADNTN